MRLLRTVGAEHTRIVKRAVSHTRTYMRMSPREFEPTTTFAAYVLRAIEPPKTEQHSPTVCDLAPQNGVQHTTLLQDNVNIVHLTTSD